MRATRATGRLLVAASIIVAGCAARGSSADEQARRDVDAAMRRYSELLRATATPESLTARFVEHGELIEPGMPSLKGHSAILAFLKPLVALVHVDSASMTSESIDVFGADAIQWGMYYQQAGEIGKPAKEYRGRFVAAWRKEADGAWRIRRLLMQPSP